MYRGSSGSPGKKPNFKLYSLHISEIITCCLNYCKNHCENEGYTLSNSSKVLLYYRIHVLWDVFYILRQCFHSINTQPVQCACANRIEKALFRRRALVRIGKV
mgnify:CR=1 FL=1